MKPTFSCTLQQTGKPSRRTFLQSGVAACSVGAWIRPILARRPLGPYYKAVFDERFDAARVFAAQMNARNIPTVAIRGDITRLFCDDLDLRWKQGPVWLTGLTAPASLFCLDLLARDRGMRLSHCLMQPRLETVLAVLDGAPPRRDMMAHLPPADGADLVFWIIAPSARASAQETANA